MRTLLRPCCMLFLLITGHASAVALTISPVSLQMDAGQKAISLTIKNDSADAAPIQLRVFRWTQEKGNDQFRETGEIVISPPFVTLAAGRSYNVRIFRKETLSPAQELSYRVIIDEIPRPVDTRSAAGGVKMSLRTSHPLFITSPDAVAAVTWSLKRDNRGWYLSARNDGTRHALLTDVYLVDRNSHQKVALNVNSVNGYILGHSYRDYDIRGTPFTPMTGHRYAVEAKINGKAITGTL